MWICKSEVEIQGRGDLWIYVLCVFLSCWAFGMAWNGGEKIGVSE
ncbi:hypothetical protein [Bartonella grahamii]|nr:hypothetical protein [Bartonella grahamii]